MRFSACIAAVVCLTTLEAAVRFTEPVWRPDLGLSVPCLADADADPLPMPRATSYLVSSASGERTLEDRYDTFDLWAAFSLRGRWRDAEGNRFLLARLPVRPPADAPGTVRVRKACYADLARRPVDLKDPSQRDEAVEGLSPVDIGAPVRPRRSRRSNLTEVWYYPSTNEHALVCAFRPRSPERKETPCWYLAALVAAPGSDMNVAMARFDSDFLDRIAIPAERSRPTPAVPFTPFEDRDEEFLLRRDVRASVANYDDWHSAEADGVVVLDDLDVIAREALVGALTNRLPRLRRAYADCVPTPLSATNRTALVRVFRSREEYLGYVGAEHRWTAALWHPLTRELVLYLPETGSEDLLRTVWHEAFHQYLAYAGSMIESSAWFNEGHAQLFQNSRLDSRTDEPVFERDEQAAAYVQEYAAELAEILPALLQMDYAAFYDGSQAEIQAKYRLAWSIAYFLEVGAPKLRFRPFEDLRRDYLKALVSTRRADRATAAVLDEETRGKFIAAWLAFWRRQ